MRKALKKLITMTLVISFITGCSLNNFNSEAEVSSAINDGKFNKLHDFVIRNLETENDKVDKLVTFAIESMIEDKNPENIKFLDKIYNDLIEKEKYEELKSFAYFLDKIDAEEDTTDLYYDVISQTKAYSNAKEMLPKLNEDHKALITEKDSLIKEIPFDIPFIGKNVEGFSGSILQKVDFNTYSVYHDIIKSEFILITTETEFTSQGQIALLVIHGGTKKFILQNGFEKEFRVLHEVPKQYKETIEEINELVAEINSLEENINVGEDIINNNKSTLKNMFDEWFYTMGLDSDDDVSTRDDSASSKKLSELNSDLEEEVSNLKHKLYLGMSKNEVETLLGTPSDELDMGSLYPRWVYDEGDIYISITWSDDWALLDYRLEYSSGENIIQYNLYSDGVEEENIF